MYTRQHTTSMRHEIPGLRGDSTTSSSPSVLLKRTRLRHGEPSPARTPTPWGRRGLAWVASILVGVALLSLSARVVGAAVSFVPPGGLYPTAQTVTLLNDNPERPIAYTLDGSRATSASLRFLAPIPLSATSVLRAVEIGPDGYEEGPEAFAHYLIGVASPLPIFSLIVDPFDLYDPETGIFANPHDRGDEWERPMNVAYVSEDRKTFLNLPGGIRTHGKVSRWYSKKSVRLYFRAEYGASKLRYRLFHDSLVEEWNQVLLRSGSQDYLNNETLLRNQPLQDIFREYDESAPTGDFCVLFLNGKVWGIYNSMERMDDEFMEDNYGIKDGDLIDISWYANALEGDTIRHQQFYNYYNTVRCLTPQTYAEYGRRMDIANFTLYQQFEIAAGNTDWPQANVNLFRDRAEGGVWRWLLYDLDLGQGIVEGPDNPTLEWAIRDRLRPDLRRDYEQMLWTTLLQRRLLENPDYRRYFIDSYAHLLSTTLSPDFYIPRLEAAHDRIASSYDCEIAAWGGTRARWETNVEKLKDYWRQRPAILLDQIRAQFNMPEPVGVEGFAPPEGEGWINVNGTSIRQFPWTGHYFPGGKMRIEAVPARGYRFDHWEESVWRDYGRRIIMTVDGPTSFTPVFAPATETVSPNDVVFNELWVGDNGTSYPSLENRAIEGAWIELLVARRGGVDLRGWRVTNNPTLATSHTLVAGQGSLLLPDLDCLAAVPEGTRVLLLPELEDDTTRGFFRDELDPSTGRIVLYGPNLSLDTSTDPGFQFRRDDEALVLLHPGPTASFGDDIGVDFVSERFRATPQSFGVAGHGVIFARPFEGIGRDDGAVFVNDPNGGLNNDDGRESEGGGIEAGPGGWIIDPPSRFTGDDGATNILTPGAPNFGQWILTPPSPSGFILR